jgi:hypothetical protein
MKTFMLWLKTKVAISLVPDDPTPRPRPFVDFVARKVSHAHQCLEPFPRFKRLLRILCVRCERPNLPGTPAGFDAGRGDATDALQVLQRLIQCGAVDVV